MRIEQIHSNGQVGIVMDNENIKVFKSEDYNFTFKKSTGLFHRWGKTLKDDPPFSIFGPEILDIEVSTICHGVSGPCKHCYKSNTPVGKNMSYEAFVQIFNKLPKVLTQIAFGIGDINSNPDLFKMFAYCRENGVLPNLTLNGYEMTEENAKAFAKYCGSVAVSRYPSNPEICYDTVKKLTDAGCKQVNIHCIVAKETLDECWKVLNMLKDKTEPRLERLNAVLFLLMKPKGKRNTYHSVTFEDYKKIIDFIVEHKILVGFDSCSTPFVLKSALDNKKILDILKLYSESCESSLFSSYINVNGRYWHCSFTENNPNWEGIDVVNCNDFIEDVWFHPETLKFRGKLLNQEHELGKDCRTCVLYDDLYSGEKF